MRSIGIAVIAMALGLGVGAGAAQAADTYQIDPVHSFANFSIGHLGIGLVKGSFTDIAGTIAFDQKEASVNAIEVTIKTASIDTHSQKRDEDLRSANFFDVEKFPTMTFKSTKVEKKLKKNRYAVTGDLTVHGVTRSITVTAKHLGSGTDPWGGYRAGFAADFAIKRSDFGIKHDLPAIADDVKISVAFEAVRK